MRVVFYISGHGFGHASRAIEVIEQVAERRPRARIAVRTAVPAEFFARARTTIDLQHADVDTGMVQIDSLRLDVAETARRAAAFYTTFPDRVEREATLLRQMGADLVVGDIPPLAFAAAAHAGLPSVAVANFTWDWIYGAYPEFQTLAPDAIPTISRAYATATCALRLPLHGGFEPMRPVTRDIPFIARRSVRDRRETRRLLGIEDARPAVLPSFGSYGVRLPLDALARSSRFSIVPGDEATLRRHGLAYPDLVAAADVVVSKPGYGIVSECMANSTALLYSSRGHFIEYDVFVAGMPRFLRCREIAQEELLAGRWADAVEAVLGQPSPPGSPRVDGAGVAADEIVSRCD